MRPRNNHFFATRNNGIDQSDKSISWRYGKGNIFAPNAEAPDYLNAKVNADVIMREFFPDAASAGVILQSEYKKGICKVSSALLASNQYPKDQYGRTVVKADGLFTTEINIPLLNASGDAHAIVFEAPNAVGIIVGAWRCLGKDIINNMLDCFAAEEINFSDINVYVGPGLGKDSYSIGMPTLEELEKVFGDSARTAAKEKVSSRGKQKYVLDVLTLMQEYGKQFKFNVFVDESKNTFDKTAWKKVKEDAMASKNPQLPIDYYTHSALFSARLYVRVDRLARRIANEAGHPNPTALVVLPADMKYEDLSKAGATGRYNETGRCLNGVMRRP